MDCKLLILVPALVILLIVLYNRKVSNRYVLAVGLFTLLLLNETIKYSEHFQDTNENKDAIALIDKALLNKELKSTDDMLKNYEHEMDVLEATVNPMYKRFKEEKVCTNSDNSPSIQLDYSCPLKDTQTKTTGSTGSQQQNGSQDGPGNVVINKWSGQISGILDTLSQLGFKS